MTEKKLAGKRAVVTGASAGMGQAIALRLAREGADIWAAGGANAGGLRETIDGCAASGGKAGGRGYDFSRWREAGDAVREGADFLGGLDILIHCAGTRNFDLLTDLTDGDIERMYDVNVKSFFAASREAERVMTPQGGGQILFMGSVSGERARAKRSLYCSGKAAIHMLAKCLALEYAPLGIRVNCLAPGLVDSGRVKTMLAGDAEGAAERVRGIPLGRLGDPEQIAAAVAFLLSPENEFMTGAIVAIDGGALAG